MTYPFEYFDSHSQDSMTSALGIFPAILKRYLPGRVLDVGCGLGCFLYPFWMMGSVVQGVDGSWTPQDKLAIPSRHFRVADFENSFAWENANNYYSLAICLEVAEHLSESRADPLVDCLCGRVSAARAHGDILFSAATPGQGGFGHVNEQPHEYWIEKFAKRGYQADLSIREDIQLPGVAPWYRNNLIWFTPRTAS